MINTRHKRHQNYMIPIESPVKIDKTLQYIKCSAVTQKCMSLVGRQDNRMVTA